MDDLSQELERSIASSELAPLNDSQIEEVFGTVDSLGAVLGEELIPEIPVVKLIFAVMKAGRSISDVLLAKKIIRFLSQLDTVSLQQRETFISKLESEDRQRILGNLMLVLEKHEAFRKSEIQGRLFASLIRGELSNSEYLHLTHATSTINVDSLRELVSFYEGRLALDKASMSLLYSFAFVQLLEVDQSNVGAFGGGNVDFRKIELGQKYVDLLQ